MNRIILTLLMVLVSGCGSQNAKIVYTDPGYYLFPILRFKVIPTFDHPVIFELSRHDPYKLQVTTYEGLGGYDWKEISEVRTIELTKDEYTEVIELLRSALDFPKGDDVSGVDGDTWMLESALYQYTAVAFWEPEYQTEERGIEAFVHLKQHLHNLSK